MRLGTPRARAARPPGLLGTAGPLLDRGKQQTDEHGDDRDDNEIRHKKNALPKKRPTFSLVSRLRLWAPAAAASSRIPYGAVLASGLLQLTRDGSHPV